MNTDPSFLTATAQRGLTASLIGFGNVLSLQHKTALYTLNDSLTRMATGKLQGRWAFGLPTGTGKTRAIIEWATAVHKLNLPYSLAVSASKIDALRTLKQAMIDNGIPESKVGLLYHDSRPDGLQPTEDNDDRPFMLVTHQRIRSSVRNLRQYYEYNGQPRNLLVYDESLLASDVSHFEFTQLMEAFAAILERTKRNLEQHATIHNYVTESKAILEARFDTFNPFDADHIQQPYIDPQLAERYIQDWSKDTTISNYLKLANLDLRMVKAGKAAIVTYKIVMPEALQNVMILDASFPIRKLVHYDKTIKSAETLPDLQKLNVKFDTLKKFDHVDLYRLKSYGGRNSIEKGFKGERQMVKEVVKVIQTIPPDDAILCFVYKSQQKGGLNCAKVLQQALEGADIPNKDRIDIQTWGNETSLNCYAHCKHVFLVGVLHRDETELMGQYFGQVNDLHAAINKTITADLQRSEKAHLAYQALSRGACRVMTDGQAHAMKGYLVEIDPEIESELSQVMPGVNWHVWKPFYMPESENLIETWSKKLAGYLDALPETVQKVSCRQVRKDLKAERLARSTWSLVVQKCLSEEPSTSSKDIGGTVRFALEGQSLVRQSAGRYGFQEEFVA
jgi:hypothetical protein